MRGNTSKRWNDSPRCTFSKSSSREIVVMTLLILDVERARKERQHLRRLHERVALLGVVVIKEFETRVLYGKLRDVTAIRLALHPRRAPAVHVDHDLYARIDANA